MERYAVRNSFFLTKSLFYDKLVTGGNCATFAFAERTVQPVTRAVTSIRRPQPTASPQPIDPAVPNGRTVEQEHFGAEQSVMVLLLQRIGWAPVSEHGEDTEILKLSSQFERSATRLHSGDIASGRRGIDPCLLLRNSGHRQKTGTGEIQLLVERLKFETKIRPHLDPRWASPFITVLPVPGRFDQHAPAMHDRQRSAFQRPQVTSRRPHTSSEQTEQVTDYHHNLVSTPRSNWLVNERPRF